MEFFNRAVLATGFNDIIKDKFLEQFSTNQLDLGAAALSMLVAVLLGLVIYFIYKTTYRGVVYSATFAMSLILMCVITDVIIVTISSNIMLSLGMVGALSIVRFRSAIKDPVDIMYLFWAISIGIVVGAQQYLFGLIATAVIALICFLLYRSGANKNVCLLVIRYDPRAAAKVDQALRSIGGKLRNKTATKKCVEVTVEVVEDKLPDHVVERVSSVEGVMNAVLVNYNGEYCD